MKPSHPRPLSKLRIIRSGAKQASYKLWFNCKHVTRKMKRALGVSKAGSVYLPQEIVDCILDYVSEDRPTLLACTHLSHTWCIGARLHLFRTFTVSDSSGFEAINEIQDMKTIYLVRKLVIAQRMSQSDLIIPKITTRLNTFTHLQDLDIRYLNVGELLAWLPQHCGVLKSTLRTLTLRYPRGSTKQILCFVSLFSSLENLAVDNIEQESASDAVVPFPESSPPLTGRLTLTGILDQEFMSGLASLQKGLKFRTLDLQFCGEAQEVIDGCAGTLRRFICHPSDFRDIKSLDLSRCDSLHHVEVNFNALIRAFPDQPFFNFISTVPSSQLETCLIVSYDNDLDELEQVLSTAPKQKRKSTTSQKEEEERKRDVKITFGLDIEKEEADDRHESLKVALGSAIGNGVFEFSTNVPVLEVYPRVWTQST